MQLADWDGWFGQEGSGGGRGGQEKCKTYDGALGARYYTSLGVRAVGRLSNFESVDGRRGNESVSREDDKERDDRESEAHIVRIDCIGKF